jgi:hypothetical protein
MYIRSLCVVRRVHVFYQCRIVYFGKTYCGPRRYIYMRRRVPQHNCAYFGFLLKLLVIFPLAITLSRSHSFSVFSKRWSQLVHLSRRNGHTRMCVRVVQCIYYILWFVCFLLYKHFFLSYMQRRLKKKMEKREKVSVLSDLAFVHNEFS